MDFFVVSPSITLPILFVAYLSVDSIFIQYYLI